MWELISFLTGETLSIFSDFAACQAQLKIEEYVADGMETFHCSVKT